MRLIDADALIKAVLKWLPKDPCGVQELERPVETDICVSMIMEIEEAPTIEPMHGEWIETSEGTMCDNCHKFPYDDGEYHIANWYSDFCPHCGARMKGADDE